jgi:quercetin dioxygenase-like cupin family protein
MSLAGQVEQIKLESRQQLIECRHGSQLGGDEKMSKAIRRFLQLAVLTIGLCGLFISVNAIPGAATPSSNLTSVTLARGTDVSVGTIPLKAGTDIVVAQNTFAAGGSSGWHSHPGGAIVVVQQGELTLYRSVGNHCEATRYTAGQAFLERPDEVVDGVNTGSTTATAFVTFPGVPQGGPARIDQPNPGTCPGV